MEQISFNKTFTVEKEKPVEDWKVMMEVISKYYNKPLYWLPYKFPRQKIQDAFTELEKNKDRNFTHLLQKLHH